MNVWELWLSRGSLLDSLTHVAGLSGFGWPLPVFPVHQQSRLSKVPKRLVDRP